MEEILSLTPVGPNWEIDWEKLEDTKLHGFFSQMRKTLQNPQYHAEGNVFEHTKMVCHTLVRMPAYRALPVRQQQEVFLAALLHDIGKIRTTKWEDGKWTSPNHSAVGSRMAREFLWMECDMGGTLPKQCFRETVCSLIRYHMTPSYLLEQKNPELRIRQMACVGELAADYTLKLQCLLSEADVYGRIAEDMEAVAERVQFYAAVAEEMGCFDGPPSFASDFTKRAYFTGRNVCPEQELYDDSWGETLLLSGLPGTGKDTWAGKHCAGLLSVSLDEIRRKMGVKPTEDQGKVIQAAHAQAKEYLRKKQSFLWNATNLTDMLRKKQVDLFERYHASVRIVYLETNWQEQLRRNASRSEEVPEQKLYHMLQILEPPMPWEARRVEWHCV